jgi:putative SOS response-associated peptidase YedK
MPVILGQAAWSLWLGEAEASLDELHSLLVPYPAELMRAYPIGAAVGNVKNDEPKLMEPIGSALV